MIFNRYISLMAIVLLTFSFNQNIAFAKGPKKIEISGIVYDAQNSSILKLIDIEVIQKRDRKLLKSCESELDGEYTITLENPSPEPIDIFYSDEELNYLRVCIEGLKGDMEQKINIFLYRVKDADSAAINSSRKAIEVYYKYAIKNNIPTEDLITEYKQLSLTYSAKSMWAVAPQTQPSKELIIASDDVKLKAMQYYLKTIGFYTGDVDGVVGYKTVDAIQAWELQNPSSRYPIKAGGLSAFNWKGLEDVSVKWVVSDPERQKVILTK